MVGAPGLIPGAPTTSATGPLRAELLDFLVAEDRDAQVLARLDGLERLEDLEHVLAAARSATTIASAGLIEMALLRATSIRNNAPGSVATRLTFRRLAW